MVLLAALLAAALAWWGWRGRLDSPLARIAALARGMGLLALILLLVDPGFATGALRRRAIVLVDNSVSMHATGALHRQSHNPNRSGEWGPLEL